MALAPVAYDALAAPPALRPGRPDLAQPRPLRALRRPRLDAALLDAPPGRRAARSTPTTRSSASRPVSLRRHRRASASSTRAPPATPSTAGPPGSRRPPARSARAIATSVGMAIASKWQGAPLRRRALRLRRLRDRRRRLPDGGRLPRSRLARRPPQARQPLLDLRQQPHHDRRQHRARLRRRRAARFEGYGWNVTRVGDANDLGLLGARLRGVQGRGRPPDPDRRRQPHRLGLAAQAGHRSRPRRTARRGGGASDQARLRLARGRPVPRPRRRPRALRRGDRQARRRAAAPPGRQKLDAYAATTPSSPPRSRRCSGASCPTAGTPAIPTFEADEEKGIATRKASNKVQNAIAERLPWLLAGSADLTDSTSVRLTFDGAADFEPGSLRRPPAPLRHPRARVGGDLQRPLALQAAAALVDLPHLLRLRAARRSASRR